MRRFYLFPRNGIYYAQLVDPESNRRLSARSTGTTTRDEAVLVVGSWLREGIPLPRLGTRRRAARAFFSVRRLLDELQTLELTQEDVSGIVEILTSRGLLKSATVTQSLGDVLFEDFLLSFWDYDKSEYIRQKLAHGLQIRRPHCVTSIRRARRHWFPFFKGRYLADLSSDDLKKFCVWISKPEFKLSAATRNRILVVGKTALKWAFDNDMLTTDVTRGIMTFKGDTSERGILTPEEATELFRLKWPDEKAKLANILAATTGMRAGEVGGLWASSVGDRIQVCQAWGETEGLKPTKNTETRVVPLLPAVRAGLIRLAEENPHGNQFVFWGTSVKSPIELRRFNDELQKMLVVLKVGPCASPEIRVEASRYWKRRKVGFHSWRHFWATQMVGRVDPEKLMRATGHKSRPVFEVYAGHLLESGLVEIGVASGELFGKLISDPTGSS